MTNWSKIVIEAQREAGISQRQLCAMSGVNRGTIRKLLAGRAIPFDLLGKVLAVLGYELGVTRTGPAQQFKPEPRIGVRKHTLVLLARARMGAL